METDTTTKPVEVYASGLVCCSACAPADMPREDVEARVNIINPTGISSLWRISDDQTFRSGEENGGVVDCHNGHTRAIGC